MKFLVVLAAVVGCSLAKPEPQFRFNQGQYNPSQYNVYPGQYNQGQYRPQYYTQATQVKAQLPAINYNYRVSDEANAQILKFDNDLTPEGAFQYSYETSNGIAAQAVGSPRSLGGNPPSQPTVVQGGFSWTSPEGKLISISYIADENGYQAVGDSIPTPPPIPEAILRSIEFNRRNARP